MGFTEQRLDWVIFVTYRDDGQMPEIDEEMISLAQRRSITLRFHRLRLFERGGNHFFFGAIFIRQKTNNEIAFLEQDFEFRLWPQPLKIKVVRFKKAFSIWYNFMRREKIY